tara:strand:- start:626 stop:799 length:174 start_codon:yes stop_codon:yes gene_type:complete
MIQLNETDVCRLITACDYYKDATGSEYMWDQYELLQNKLKAYGEEVSTTELTCNVES